MNNTSTQFKKGHKPFLGCFGKGSKHTEESKLKISNALKGRPGLKGKDSPNYGKKAWNSGKKLSKEHIEKLKKSHIGIQKMEKHPMWKGGRPKCKYCGKQLKSRTAGKCLKCAGLLKRGENHFNWKGDKRKKSTKKHLDNEYKYWSLTVKRRDLFKCRLSSSDCKGRLESHHIYNWIEYPELRYVVNNGITLCAFHHPHGREEEKRMIPIFQEL
jgi:hypothetical protein